jgi:hypothetical protein
VVSSSRGGSGYIPAYNLDMPIDFDSDEDTFVNPL